MNIKFLNTCFRPFVTAFALGLALSLSASAQNAFPAADLSAANVKPDKSGRPLSPAIRDFRGAHIGMDANALRELWGKPDTEDAQGFLYKLSDESIVQVALDADKKVRVIAATFLDTKAAPKATDVFGPDASISVKHDSSVHHMVRYPDAGYWVSYSKVDGDDGVVTLMMQKL